MLRLFFHSCKKVKNEALPGDDNYEQSQGWQLTHEQLEAAYHLNRSAFKHLHEGSRMSLQEFERWSLAVFAIAQTEEECLKVWMNIGSLLFSLGHDDEVQVPSPLQHTMLEVYERMKRKEVTEEVEKQLRLEHIKQMTDAIQK